MPGPERPPTQLSLYDAPATIEIEASHPPEATHPPSEVLPRPQAEPVQAPPGPQAGSPQNLSNEPRRCDKRCGQCKGTNLAVCPESKSGRCYDWERPCRYLKTSAGWHFHLCKIGQRLRGR